jgi:hypothetical protein
MMISIDLTGDTAQAVLWALREHRNHRFPVREYVDKHYANMDEPFRNRKIGEVQDRLDRLQSLENRLLTKLAQASASTGESK